MVTVEMSVNRRADIVQGTIAAGGTKVPPLAGTIEMSEASTQQPIRIPLVGSNQVRNLMPQTIVAAPGLASKTGIPLTGQVDTLSCGATAPREVSEQRPATLETLVTTSTGSKLWSYGPCGNSDGPPSLDSAPEGTICTGLTPTSCSRESYPLTIVELDLSSLEELDFDRDGYSPFTFDRNTEAPHNLLDNCGSFDMDITGIGEQFSGMIESWSRTSLRRQLTLYWP